MILAKATMRATQDLALSHTVLARVIGFAEPTISRIANGCQGIDPHSKQGQLAQLLVRLFRSLNTLLGGDTQKIRNWLHSHNTALNGIPTRLIETPQGLVTVLSYLDGVQGVA